MIGAVVESSLDAYGRITSENTLLDSVAETLFNGGEEVLRNRAADNSLCKLEIVGIVGLELDPDVAELTVTAALLLVTTLSRNLLADSLAVSDLWVLKSGFHVVLALKPGDNNVEVLFAET